ncbi:hypothetical protein A1OE_804 [Candidatus Endolissoclinum faulkneri L2]|uniref:Uncharacterized protein n=1 Tax=Candidatus Endolissoclinum faulkneri L2 TaxID=1193729 RepID=K7YR42_9PROT|nr:hypothetical protein A1OE_804 [Candidatus Endolissoclinum faulkneri L2]
MLTNKIRHFIINKLTWALSITHNGFIIRPIIFLIGLFI